MPWPPTLAAKIISKYIADRYDMDAITIRRYNPPMGAMPFFNNSASPGIRRGELTLVAGSILKALIEMDIPLEKNKSYDDAMDGLVAELEKEDSDSSQIVVIIDQCYRFRDEDED